MSVCRRFPTGWLCVSSCEDPAHDEFLPARTKPTADTLRADLAATTAADAKVIWNRALKGGAA